MDPETNERARNFIKFLNGCEIDSKVEMLEDILENEVTEGVLRDRLNRLYEQQKRLLEI